MIIDEVAARGCKPSCGRAIIRADVFGNTLMPASFSVRRSSRPFTLHCGRRLRHAPQARPAAKPSRLTRARALFQACREGALPPLRYRAADNTAALAAHIEATRDRARRRVGRRKIYRLRGATGALLNAVVADPPGAA